MIEQDSNFNVTQLKLKTILVYKNACLTEKPNQKIIHPKRQFVQETNWQRTEF